MSRRGRIIFVISSLVVLVIIGFFAYRQVSGRRVPLNEYSVAGNTAGNLYNGGLYCEFDGRVYFSNTADGGCLYSMNPDETNMTKLSTMEVGNILCGGNFIYCYMHSSTTAVGQGLGVAVQEYGIYRMRNDGKYAVCLLREVVETMQLGGPWIYFMQGDDMTGTLERIRVDKRDRSTWYNEHINPASYQDGAIYYNGVASDHTLYRLNTQSDNPSPQIIYTGNVYQPVINGSYIYYLDAENGYRICRYLVSSGISEELTSFGADSYNMNGEWIYFDSQDAETPGLYRMRTDGSALELIQPGVYYSLNLTSEYLYYKIYGADDITYHIPLNGAQTPSMFLQY